mmetsp:Transcript_5964/g.16974  ORF Transcript_5964/g.16974 Transcript_5964/m.16974 type:complete len:136 (+) Transcript_5964:566-973(+)
MYTLTCIAVHHHRPFENGRMLPMPVATTSTIAIIIKGTDRIDSTNTNTSSNTIIISTTQHQAEIVFTMTAIDIHRVEITGITIVTVHTTTSKTKIINLTLTLTLAIDTKILYTTIDAIVNHRYHHHSQNHNLFLV